MTPDQKLPSTPTEPSQLHEWRTTLADEGVVVIRGALDTHAMRHAQRAFHWSLQHPGPRAHTVLAGIAGAFYQDHANPAAFPAYHDLLCETGLAELVGNLISSQGLWLLYEQIWLKRGSTLRTPWHQDLAYVPMAGEQLATAWINLDPVERERSLEFVRGSHRGLLYNPTAFDPDDPAAAMYAPGVWPALPDIEARRDAWPIVSAAIEPGDIVVFHPAALHGGAPTRAGDQRRTISLRFFGDDTSCMPRPESGVHEVDRLTTDNGRGDPMVAMARQPAGALFRHPDFPCLRSPAGAASVIRAGHE